MPSLNLVLIGPPGCGKGTQAAQISERYGVPPISTGDILRAAVKAGSALGRAVKATMASGALVSDDMMIDLVRDRLARRDVHAGFILDGFPRTEAQADALDTIVAGRPLVALVLDVPERELIRRLVSRRICTGCKRLTTGGTFYGSEAELCSRCGAPLMMRADDNEQTIRNRLLTFHSTADPLIRYYEARGLVETVNGFQAEAAVTAEIFAALDRRLQRAGAV